MSNALARLIVVLSYTWGLLLTLIGLCVAGVLELRGYRATKIGFCRHYKVGKCWGGLNLGAVILTDDSPSDHTLKHEFGHSVQNAFFGPFCIFLVLIPSATRYHWRNYQKAHGKTDLPPYDSIWFEGQATAWGHKYIDLFN